MKIVDIVRPDVMALWFTYGLVIETQRLRWLTVALVVLTVVLAVLTFRLAIL
jgi:hypothetical protein